MLLAAIVGATMLVVVALMGAIGYVIERSAGARETGVSERRPPLG
jgi:hypothetical protein